MKDYKQASSVTAGGCFSPAGVLKTVSISSQNQRQEEEIHSGHAYFSNSFKERESSETAESPPADEKVLFLRTKAIC